jgi:hypothetical protein
LTLRLQADVDLLKNSAEHDADAAVRDLCIGCLGQLQLKLQDNREA